MTLLFQSLGLRRIFNKENDNFLQRFQDSSASLNSDILELPGVVETVDVSECC